MRLPKPETQPGSAAAAAAGSYPSALPAWATRRRLIFLGVGALAYGLALIATLPARLVLPVPDATGTVWRGAAPLPGGDRVAWRWAPLRSLVNLGFAVDWEVKGATADLAGHATLGRDWTLVEDASGRIDAAALAFALPALPFRCALGMQVDLARVKYGGGGQGVTGEVVGDAGACRANAGGGWLPVPPLVFRAAPLGRASAFSIAPAGQRRRSFMTGTLDQDGRLGLTVTREGAAALPFASPPGGLAVATDL